jgi:hypothetical protein
MDVLEYLVNSLAWSAGGLISGYLLGRRSRQLIEEEPDHDDT